MADNHNPRSADKDVAFLGDDDPLAELMRIAGLEPQVDQASREPAEAEPDEFDFDLEAELLRSFDVSETPATFVENADEPFAEQAPAAVSAEPAAVEELPAFLQRRPPADEPALQALPPVEAEAFTVPVADDDDGEIEPVEPRVRAVQPVDEEWVDLPEWTRPSGQSRTDAFERPAVEVEVEAHAETPTVDESFAPVVDDTDVYPIESAISETELVGAGQPDSEPEPEPEQVPAVEGPVEQQASLDGAVISEDRAEIEPASRDEADTALDAALNDFDFSAIDLGEDQSPDVVDEIQAPSEAVVTEPQPAEPTNVRATDWDIADDLERAFRELETGTLPGQPLTVAAPMDPIETSALAEPFEDAPEPVRPAEPVRSVDIEPAPAVSAPIIGREPEIVREVEPAPDAMEAVAAPVGGEAALASEVFAGPAEEVLPVEGTVTAQQSDDLDLDFDFEDLELELREDARQALDAEPVFEPRAETAPDIVPAPAPAPAAAAVAVAPMAAAAHWHVPSAHAAMQRADARPAASDDFASKETQWTATDDPVDDVGSDLAFNIHEVASTDTFIEPVGEIDVPELPRDEDWQAVDRLDDLDLSGVEAEFADILSQGDMTAPPATTEPSRIAAASNSGVSPAEKAPVQIDFADFDFTSLSRPEFSGAAAATALATTGVATSGNTQPAAAAARQPATPRSHAIVEGFDDERGLYAEDAPSGERGKRFSLPVAPRTTALVLFGAFVVVGLGAYALSGGGEMLSDEPRVIAADSEPIKVVPDDPGGRAVPNQDQAVYDQVDGRGPDGEAQLVSRAEEPVDIVQRTLDPEVLPLEGRPAGDDIGAVIGSAEDDEALSARFSDEQESDGAMNVAARRVQTMVVRPDGTLVPREEAVGPASDAGAAGEGTLAGAGDPLSPTTLLTEAASTAPARETAVDALPQELPGDEAVGEAAAVPPAERLTPEAEPVTAPTTDQALTAPVRTVETTALTGEGVPVPPNRPADQPVTIVGNASQPGASVAPAAPAAAEVAAAQPQAGLGENPGGYVVQIASQPTQESAQSTYQSLASRFGSIIGGRGYQIQAADIPDRGTFYRVRVAGGTREEAVALCERYQAAGGSCFVAR